MVLVEVGVAQGVDEVAGGEIADLGHHHRQQRVGGDVEGDAEEGVGAALVELAGEPPLGHPELEQGMAGGEGHGVEIRHVPGADDVPPRVGVLPDRLDDARDLVDRAAVPGRPGAPLRAVDRPEVALGVRPLVPDGHAVLVERADVGVAGEEPEQLVDDRAEVQLLGGQQREALGEVEAHLVAEDRERAGAGAVGLRGAVVQDVLEQVQVGPHGGRI